MLRSILVCALASSPLVADVMPHCGGPQVSLQAPGEWCGHHGPQRRGDCQAPAVCYVVEGRGDQCTAECATDSDCAPLGAGFTCSARGRPLADNASEARPVCRPPDAAASR